MAINRLGYCCINLELKEANGVSTNRSIKQKTFQQYGINYASQLALKNVNDLLRVIRWNNTFGVRMYRLSSDIFPWASEYEISALPDYPEIKATLQAAGEEANRFGQRLTYHPGPFSVLASDNPTVVNKTIKDFRQHAEVLDLLNQPESPDAPINIHLNTTKPNKLTAALRFKQNFAYLPSNVQNRLVVENDDKGKQYTVEDLYELVYQSLKLPITFDYHHFYCHPGNLTQTEALKLAAQTWPKGITPLTHYSSSKQLYEDNQAKLQAHAYYLYEQIDTANLDIDVEIEAKGKEKALFNYQSIYS